MAALGDGGGGVAQAEPAGEADGDAADDVPCDVGQRPRTQQQMRLGATPDGKLVSLEQHYRNHTSFHRQLS